jgi:hypothetical protein
MSNDERGATISELHHSSLFPAFALAAAFVTFEEINSLDD